MDGNQPDKLIWTSSIGQVQSDKFNRTSFVNQPGCPALVDRLPENAA
ncbi:hypothetical protein [Egbenema bharatensis]